MLLPHAAAQDDGVVAYRAERVGELVQVRGPIGEDEAVPALGQRGRRIVDDRPGEVTALLGAERHGQANYRFLGLES